MWVHFKKLLSTTNCHQLLSWIIWVVASTKHHHCGADVKQALWVRKLPLPLVGPAGMSASFTTLGCVLVPKCVDISALPHGVGVSLTIQICVCICATERKRGRSSSAPLCLLANLFLYIYSSRSLLSMCFFVNMPVTVFLFRMSLLLRNSSQMMFSPFVWAEGENSPIWASDWGNFISNFKWAFSSFSSHHFWVLAASFSYYCSLKWLSHFPM